MSTYPAPEHNPYASPKAMAPPISPYPQYAQGPDPLFGLFRQGNVLVMHKNAPLPDRCIKSNVPAEGRTLRRNLRWHPQIVYLALLVNLIIYIIVAAILTKTATIQIGLCDAWIARRWRIIAVAWGLVLLGVALFGGGIALIEDQPNAGPIMMLSGVAVFLIGAIYGLMAARLVYPQKITDTHVWLKGVHPDYLANLPNWPYPY